MPTIERSERVSITTGSDVSQNVAEGDPNSLLVFQKIFFIYLPTIVKDKFPVFLGKCGFTVMLLLIDNILFYDWYLVFGIENAA